MRTLTKIHTLPGVTLSDAAQLEPNAEVVQACEDMLQLAKEGKIRAIAHAYVTNHDLLCTGWRNIEKEHLLAATIHRLAHRYEAASADGEEVQQLPSDRA